MESNKTKRPRRVRALVREVGQNKSLLAVPCAVIALGALADGAQGLGFAHVAANLHALSLACVVLSASALGVTLTR